MKNIFFKPKRERENVQPIKDLKMIIVLKEELLDVWYLTEVEKQQQQQQQRDSCK